ncbi:MAG: class I SAM-dependent methyltransferase [Planctomycetota bacterium]
MPLSHDRPSLERSPDQHDAEAIPAGSTEADRSALEPWLRRAPEGPVLDLACGSGRHVRALGRTGRAVYGLDLDPRMIAACRQADPDAPADRYRVGDASMWLEPRCYAALCLLNSSLVCFHSHRLAAGLFHSAAHLLLPGGLFLIDNCCVRLWDEIRSGNFADGISEDGTEQLFFLAGENRFVWRRGAEVDAGSWEPGPGDRLYRLWSLNEVALAAEGAGLTLTCLDPAESLIVVERPVDA